MMKKINDSIVVIGESITEFYYFHSLKDKYRHLDIKPTFPKHSTGLDYLEQEINKAIEDECSLIICVIDMDNKKEGKEKIEYEQFKHRFEGHHTIKTGVNCEIRFIENERCLELFFLYYFTFTTRCFQNQQELLDELNKKCRYEKNEKFFKKHPLHQYFEESGGDIEKAIRNAKKSMKEKGQTGRDHTYSQMADLFDALGISVD